MVVPVVGEVAHLARHPWVTREVGQRVSIQTRVLKGIRRTGQSLDGALQFRVVDVEVAHRERRSECRSMCRSAKGACAVSFVICRSPIGMWRWRASSSHDTRVLMARGTWAALPMHSAALMRAPGRFSHRSVPAPLSAPIRGNCAQRCGAITANGRNCGSAPVVKPPLEPQTGAIAEARRW